MTKMQFLRLLCAALAIVPLAGCGDGRSTSDAGVVHLQVWSMWSGDEERSFEAVLAEYHKEHPGVVVDNLGAVTDEKSVRAIIAGAPPDLFTITDPSYLGTLAANNALEPLDGQFEAAGFKDQDFTPGALDECRYQGRLYAMPYLMDCIALLYNKDVFKDAGLDPNKPPRTYDELVEDCRKITRRDAEGRLTRIGLHPVEISPALLMSMFDGRFIDERGRITADDPNNIEGVTAYMRLMDAQGGYPAVQSFASGFGANTGAFNPFFHGDVGMLISGEWNAYTAFRYSPGTHYGVVALPYPGNHPNRAGLVWLADNPFCIPRGSKHAREAWEFLKWTQTPLAQKMLASTLHNVPNLRSELHDKDLIADPPFVAKSPKDVDPNSWRPLYGKFLALADSPTATGFPTMPVASMYAKELSNVYDSVGYGTKKPAEALAAIDVRVQREMDKYQ